MKKKFQNLRYLLTYAWNKSKLLFLTTSLKNVFRALLPLIDIVGIGFVVDALTSGKTREEIIFAILFYGKRKIIFFNYFRFYVAFIKV